MASEELSATDLAELLGHAPGEWLQTPEAQLLFFSALSPNQPERALGFLNGFLAQHGLGCPLSLKAPAASGNFLAGVQVRPTRVVADGPLVSIVVPAHDAAATLGYALESLLQQSYRSVEILVGDDASSDGTLEIMRRYAGDPRVRLFRSEQNQGAYNLRNALLARARGAFVTFHDADDLALPSRVERQVAQLRRAGVVGCVTNHLRLTPGGSVVFFKNQKATRLSRVSLMLRRQLFEELGPFRSAQIGADEELHAKIMARFGRTALSRIVAPLSLSLWSSASATRALGQEALEDGYRSPSRRAYSELVFRRYGACEPIADSDFEARLRETNNYVAPNALLALS